MSVSFHQVVQQRGRPGPEVQAEFADFTRLAFAGHEGVPVIVPTYNEAEDLPVTLLALARSTLQLEPIIVDSSSPDDTAEIAAEMGATVISVARGQMLGYKAGIEHVQRTRSASPLLITDADCISGRRWAETLIKRANIPSSTGGVAFGTTVFFNGESCATDLVRSLYALVGDQARKVTHQPARQRGTNCHVQLDEAGAITDRMLEFEDMVFPCDILLAEAIQEVSGLRLSVTSPRAVVLTNGDRYPNLQFLLSCFVSEKLGRSSRIERYADHGFTNETSSF